MIELILILILFNIPTDELVFRKCIAWIFVWYC